jgi:predicted amidohydrolase
MIICLAQTRSVKGNIEANIERHLQFINYAIERHADFILFPELSLTGYEPQLAESLSLKLSDQRLEVFQRISDKQNIVIAVGAPTRSEAGIEISLIIFQPQKERLINTKKHLHADEKPFFVEGKNIAPLTVSDNSVAFAICYELSVTEHFQNANQYGATLYAASVAKSATGMESANYRLGTLAKEYSISTCIANGVGSSDNFMSAGKSSAWNKEGHLLGQLNDTDEGILVVNTITETSHAKHLNAAT